MAYTSTDLNNIKAAIATGAQTVEIGGKRVTYRTLDEMVEVRTIIESEINAVTGRSRVKQLRVIAEKGL
jgi:collagenase-like PrtC family protease